MRRLATFTLLAILAFVLFCPEILAQEPGGPAPSPEESTAAAPSIREIIRAGGKVGYVIVALSFTMVALIVEHAMRIRRPSLMPRGLAEQVHSLIAEQKFQQAEQVCDGNPSFLANVLRAGVGEVPFGYSNVEKAMEDTSQEQTARLFRRIDYLSVIGTIAPMLGLLGTVWGMILAFVEFESKANPQVSELAPGIYKALITTLMGLGVAVPSLFAFAVFRNRIEDLASETSLLAESVFADFKRAAATRNLNRRRAVQRRQPAADAPSQDTSSGEA